MKAYLLTLFNVIGLIAITACSDHNTAPLKQPNEPRTISKTSKNPEQAPKTSVTQYSQDTQHTSSEPSPLPTGLIGIDVSHFQGQIDWQKVSQQNVHYVFIKASQGRHTVDHDYQRNWAKAGENGLLRGVYHYLDPSLDASTQANHFVNVTQGDFGDFPPIVDIEAFEKENAQQVIGSLKTFISELGEISACKPMIYTSPGFWNQLDDHEFGRYELWLADYAKKPTLPNGWSNWAFWQFESNGTIAGINGKVDKNKYRGNKNQLRSLSCQKMETKTSTDNKE